MEALFYQDHENISSGELFLDEASSKHIIQVLRMTNGERIRLTNGRGIHAMAEIINDNRKKTGVRILSSENIPSPSRKVSIAISPLKNISRFEWFLEKATEIGVTEIIPLICDRTEKTNLKTERLNGILVSAMIQSGQYWKPAFREPIRFVDMIRSSFDGNRYVAHCESDQERKELSATEAGSSKQILIGPEGDFSPAEIQQALKNDFLAVSLGNTRLRTETAGIVAATLLCR